jgi:hypothetical protein
LCHGFIHWGFTSTRSEGFQEAVFEHALKVNGCTIDELMEMINESEELYEKRRRYRWRGVYVWAIPPWFEHEDWFHFTRKITTLLASRGR